MGVVVVVLVALALVVGICAYGVVLGRTGADPDRRIAFNAGLAGLVAVPLWFIGLIGIVGQLMFADFASPAGILLLAASAALLVAPTAVLVARARLGRRPRHPPRAAKE